MENLTLIFSFILGAIIGSFLNVVSLRFRTGVGIGGRSKCMSCSKELKWYELVPLLSFLVQKGMCRKCKGKISWQYPLVEFISGLLFVMVFLTFPPLGYMQTVVTFVQLVLACFLVVLVVYDIKHKILPDALVYSFDLLALISLFVGGESWWHMPGWDSLLAGPLLSLPFALIWLISKGNWMGLGDAKLVLGLGWMLGINAGINAVILAFWIGAVISVGWLFYTYKKFKPKTEIPFGPYLVLGMYIVLIFGVNVIDIDLLKDIIWSLWQTYV